MSFPIPGRYAAALVLTLICLSTTALAAAPHVARDKDLKPRAIAPRPAGVIFDCTARDTLTLAPDVVLSFKDDTTDAPANLPGYGCNDWEEESPEHIYRLEVTTDLEFWAGLSGLDADLDLILLNDCDTDSCLVIGNMEVSARLSPGTYYLIVDGFSRDGIQSGPYTLDISCRWPGLPAVACQVGLGGLITCANETLTRTGDLFGKPNLVQSYDCSPIIERGGEVWYQVTLPGFHEFTAQLTEVPEAQDMALWLFADCGPEAQCLGFAGENLAGIPEDLYLANNGELPLTVYLAVDTYRPVDNELGGAFTIDFECQSNVADQKTSFGSLRALYR